MYRITMRNDVTGYHQKDAKTKKRAIGVLKLFAETILRENLNRYGTASLTIEKQ